MNITHNGSKAGMEFAEHLSQIVLDRYRCEEAWRTSMSRKGIVATHPDDGWVDRVKNTIWFCYPHIMGKLEPGALVALGDFGKYRIVRLVSFERSSLASSARYGYWFFEEVTPI